jgi:MFS family permease
LFVLAAAVLVPRSGAPEPPRPTPWRTLGLLTLAVGLIAVAGLAPQVFVAALCAIAGLALLVLAARVNAAPSERLLPAEAGRPATPAGAGYAMTFALSASGAVITVYGAAVLQALYDLSPLGAGYVIAVEAMGWTGAAIIVSGAPPKTHAGLIRLGAAVVAAGVTLVALGLGRVALPLLVAAVLVQGVGFGLCWALAAGWILTALPEAERATGASAVPTAQIIGGATGAAAAGAFANLLGLARDFDPHAARAAVPLLFGAFAPLALLGVLAALRLTRAPTKA